MVVLTIAAIERLSTDGIEAALINARFANTLDEQIILAQVYVGEGLREIGDHALAFGFEGGVPLQLYYPLKLVEVMSHCTGLPDHFVEHSSRKLIHFKLESLDTAWRITSSFLLSC